MNDFSDLSHWTSDAVLDGRLTVCQSRRGYRFSIDALVLAFHATPVKPGERILDLGTGCGIIPLITAYRHPDVTITGIEIQAELAEIARYNVRKNGFENRVAIIEDDYSRLRPDALGQSVNMVVVNPPYRKMASGRVNPQHQRALARHEIAISLEGLVNTMRRFLRTGGRGWLVYTADRLAELMAAMQSRHLAPKYLRLIHSHADANAKRCLLKVVKGARPGMIVGPPLIVYKEDGAYTTEVNAMLVP